MKHKRARSSERFCDSLGLWVRPVSRKAVRSVVFLVAGLMVFSSLAAGNAAYQTLKVLGGASAVGPIPTVSVCGSVTTLT